MSSEQSILVPSPFHVRQYLETQLNRNVPEAVRIRFRVVWPAILIPFAFVNQIFAPHPVWLVLLIALLGFYSVGLIWVRAQAPYVTVVRRRINTILVVGDELHEEFELVNQSRLPVIWAEFMDESDLPGHAPGRVVACGAYAFYRWHADTSCERRGVFRLGPHRLLFGDPFGLFEVEVASTVTDVLLIYPRVVHLPEMDMPHGTAGESRRRRRPLRGVLPSASVNDYRPGDSLRHIHWRSTARRSRLMVKELEIEPSGDVWVILDLNRSAQSGEGARGTLEYSVIVAASLAAKLLSEGERRAVGLLTVSGDMPTDDRALKDDAASAALQRERFADMQVQVDHNAILVPPQPGQAQLWRILSALAPVEATNITLAELLHNSREVLGSRRTIVVITAQTDVSVAWAGYRHHAALDDTASVEESETVTDGKISSRSGAARENWLSEIAHLRSSGLDSTVLLIGKGDSGAGTDGRNDHQATEAIREFLAREDISSEILFAGTPMQAALTFRRTKRVIRSTPTGGVVSYEVEEEVG